MCSVAIVGLAAGAILSSVDGLANQSVTGLTVPKCLLVVLNNITTATFLVLVSTAGCIATFCLQRA